MTDGIVIKKDITSEAKQILASAMNNFCKAENKEEKGKAIYIAERHNYWLSQGVSHEVATQKANEDYEWSN
jgi:hypothetical protein